MESKYVIPRMFNKSTTGEIELYGIGDVLNPEPEIMELKVVNKIRYYMPFSIELVDSNTIEARRVLRQILEDWYEHQVKSKPIFSNINRKNQADLNTPTGYGRYYYSGMWLIRLTLFILEVYTLIEKKDLFDIIKIKKGYRTFYKPAGVDYEKRYKFFNKYQQRRLAAILDGKTPVGSRLILRLVDGGDMNKIQALAIYGKMLLACYLQEDPNYRPKTQLLKEAVAEIKDE